MRLNNEEIVTSVREKNCMVIGIVTGKELNKKRNFAIFIYYTSVYDTRI